MNKPKQKRTLVTRAKLFQAALNVIASKGFDALRIEEVVQDAGVAKGTFFAHFRDKDALLEHIIGAEIDAHLDRIESLASPESLDDLITHFMPLLQVMTRERCVFDVILRHSGAAAKQEMGPIAQTFHRQIAVLVPWLSGGPFRKDVPVLTLAEGVQAFALQCMALQFCAVSCEEPMQVRFRRFLEAWLIPQDHRPDSPGR